MRNILFIARGCVVTAAVLGCAGTAAAQDPGPRPFVVGALSSSDPIVGPSMMFGFDVTAGGPSWRSVQWLGQGGRLFDVMPEVGQAPMMWYGAAGARYSTRPLWRFRPYADLTAGVARSNENIPLAGVALGSHLDLGLHLTLDVGYRVRRFFGAADTTRAGTFLGLGVTF